MKKFFLLLLMIITSLTIFATEYHSVSLDSEAYRIIEIGEIRGIIPRQTDVKPYNLNTVRRLLNVIKESSLVENDEKKIIENILEDFDSRYGEERSVDLNSEDIDLLNKTHLGVELSTTQRLGKVIKEDKIFDSRNGILTYIQGDILDIVSYDLNFKVNLDRIDPNAFLPTELLFSTDGFYMDLTNGGDRLTELPDPDGRFFLGIEAFPEISTSINNDIASIRIGAVKRDWGPGVNNIALSSSARVIDGIELSLKPTSWFSYSVFTGSLGNASLKTVNDIEWPSENMDEKDGKYSNNISIHRVELELLKGLKTSIWESVIWRKRFELGYLNPLSIYMFTQNALGDYDNVLAGVDASYTIKGLGTVYGAISFDELNRIKKPFSCVRNILAYQGGIVLDVPFGTFSTLKIQGTYIPAFYGAHYLDKEELFANIPYTTAYVNKGQNIGYPVNPDTLEFLFAFDTTLYDVWNVSILVKDQLRSAQYSSKTSGTDILTYLDYTAYDKGEYYDRDFFNNIWNNIFDIELEVERKINNLTLFAGLQGVIETKRSFTPEVKNVTYKVTEYTKKELHNNKGEKLYDENGTPITVEVPVEVEKTAYSYNPGKVKSWGDWASSFKVNITIGGKIVF